MDQIRGNKRKESGPRVFGGVDAEDLVKPETRRCQVPKSRRNINEDHRDKRCEPGIAKAEHPKVLNELPVNAGVAQLDFFECVGVAAI